MIRVQSGGNFSNRLSTFNAFLSRFRAEELKRRGDGAWQRPTSGQLDVVLGARDDYLEVLANYSHTTIALLCRG